MTVEVILDATTTDSHSSDVVGAATVAGERGTLSSTTNLDYEDDA